MKTRGASGNPSKFSLDCRQIESLDVQIALGTLKIETVSHSSFDCTCQTWINLGYEAACYNI